MNQDIKFEMFKANLKQYQLASLMNMHEGNLSKMLNRQELSKEEKQKIIKLIKERSKSNARR